MRKKIIILLVIMTTLIGVTPASFSRHRHHCRHNHGHRRHHCGGRRYYTYGGPYYSWGLYGPLYAPYWGGPAYYAGRPSIGVGISFGF